MAAWFGPLSAFVVQNYGWELVFVIGGVAPLVLLVALIFLLPESLRFLVARNAPTEKTAYLMRRISGDASFTAADQFVVNEAISSNKQPVREIFSKEFFRVTTLLSFASFVTQLVIVFVITWMPTLLKAAGLPLGRAIIASATFSLGGILGSLLLARMIDIKKSYGVLVIAYIVSALAIALIGFSTGNANWVFAIVGLSGMAIVGAQVNLSAYSSTVYPTKIRSTGIGWIVGIGRAGAIAGALVGTVFVTSGLTLEVQYVIAGAPALLAGAAVYFVRTRQQHAA